MSLHSIIRDEYGQDCVKLVRDYENSAKKIANFKNHLRFNLHCKHHGVVPPSLKLSSNVNGKKAENILRRAEKQLLNVRIGDTVKYLKKLDIKNSALKTEVSRQLPGKSDDVTEFVRNAQLRAHTGCKQRQQRKFQSLLGKKTDKSVEKKTDTAQQVMARWVKNISDRILSDPELSILKKGLNFAVIPRRVPVVDTITATEAACRDLNSGDANELRARVSGILKRHDRVKEQNVSKQEWQAIEQLKRDDTIMILPADKGRVTVVMKKSEYQEKCEHLLNDEKTYKKLKGDPTRKYKAELGNVLRDLKDRKIITPDLHRKLYPTVDQPPRFYGLPKVHKNNIPLHPIVSSIGTITYECVKYLADVLSPLMGKTEHHVKNSKEFAEYVKLLKVGPDEELRSYDVSALFTSVPVDKALEIIRRRLTEDVTLSNRTPLSPDDIIAVLEKCLKGTYFLYKGEYYLHIHGAAMGSPVSPIICNIYMEEFEQRALAEASDPPRWWKRYVDDTYTVLKKDQAQAFTEYLNTIDEDIKWTTEGEVEQEIEVEDMEKKVERCLAFLDTLSVINDDGTIRTRVFRKATHTDQYLNFDSNYPLEHKRSVVRTLTHRARSIVSDLGERNEELDHVRRALGYNGYPDWLLADTRDDVKENTREEVLKTDALFVVATGTDKLCSCAFFTQYGSTTEPIHYVTTKI